MRPANTFIVGIFIGQLVIGCGKKPVDPQTEIEKASRQLIKAEVTQPVVTGATAASATPPASKQMNDALASYKSGELGDAVARFQTLRAQKAVTPEQLMAINNAMAAVMGDIYARAAKGDARAKQAVQQYERMQNGGR